MTISTTVVLQVIGFIVAAIMAVNPMQLPVKWQATFIGIVALAQGLQAAIAHYYTPTGVPITPGSTITTKENGSQAAHT